jgi:hypothetical protein
MLGIETLRSSLHEFGGDAGLTGYLRRVENEWIEHCQRHCARIPSRASLPPREAHGLCSLHRHLHQMNLGAVTDGGHLHGAGNLDAQWHS